MKRHLRLLLAALILSSTAAGAATPKVIAKLPYKITKPGTYVLSKTFNYLGPTHAIEVQADDVTVDLRGNLLNYAGTDGATTTAAGVFADSRKNVTVRNGTIRGFFRAVYLENHINSARHVVEDIVAEKCRLLGLQVKGPDMIVRRNRVIGLGSTTVGGPSRWGIFIQGERATVTDNVVLDVAPDGAITKAYSLYFIGSTSSLVQRNSALNSTPAVVFERHGFYFTNCSGLVLEANTVSYQYYGINFADSCAGAIFRNNTVSATATKYTAGGGAIDGDDNK